MDIQNRINNNKKRACCPVNFVVTCCSTNNYKEFEMVKNYIKYELKKKNVQRTFEGPTERDILKASYSLLQESREEKSALWS